MPTITHSMIGGAIALLLYTLTYENLEKGGKTFQKEHVIILALNSFIGPDYSKFLSPFFGREYWESTAYQQINGFSHSIIGWLILSFPFALLYYSLFRYTGQGKREKNAPISYMHVLILIIAGGMNHFGMDMLDSSVRVFPPIISKEYSLSITSFYTGSMLAEGDLWDTLSWFSTRYYLMLGIIFMIILIYMLNKKSLKAVWITAIAFSVIVFSLIYFIGSRSVSYENDLGLFLYAMFAWIIPLYLCYASMEKNKANSKETIREDPVEKVVD